MPVDSTELPHYRHLLQESQRIEAVATAVYATLARRLRDGKLRELMAQLATDEAAHGEAVASLLRERNWRDANLLAIQHWVGAGIGKYLCWRREDVVLLTLIQFEDGGTKTYRDMLALKCLFQNEQNCLEGIAQTEEEHTVLLKAALAHWRTAAGR